MSHWQNEIIKDVKDKTKLGTIPLVFTDRGGKKYVVSYSDPAWAQRDYNKKADKRLFDGVFVNGKRFTGEADFDTYLSAIGYKKLQAEAVKNGGGGVRPSRAGAAGGAGPAPAAAAPAADGEKLAAPPAAGPGQQVSILPANPDAPAAAAPGKKTTNMKPAAPAVEEQVSIL